MAFFFRRCGGSASMAVADVNSRARDKAHVNRGIMRLHHLIRASFIRWPIKEVGGLIDPHQIWDTATERKRGRDRAVRLIAGFCIAVLSVMGLIFLVFLLL